MRIFSFCLLLLWPVVCHAQGFKKVSCRLLCLDAENPAPPLINVGEKGVEIPCLVYTETPSPPLDFLAKDNTVSFISKEDRKLVANARIPATGNSFLLIFIAAAKEAKSLPWRVFVIENTPKNFPAGGAFVANFHNQDIRFILGESKIALPPGDSHGFPKPKELDSFNMAPVIFEFQQGEVWKTAKESMLRFLPGRRYLMFAYMDPASGRPRISTYRDSLPPPTVLVKPNLTP